MAHVVEVDQSIKLNDTAKGTVLAFSNKISYTILIPAAVKRACVLFQREYFRELRHPYMKLFAAALFLLVRDHLTTIGTIIIDTEYPGNEATIKGVLINYIRRVVPDFPAKSIVFRQIGKRSGAHKAAIAVLRGQDKPNRIIKLAEIIEVLEY